MNPPKLFIVDDESPARERLKILISDIQADCPCQIVGEAGDPHTALNCIIDTHPDIVLLDVQMPGMTGLELAQHIAASLKEAAPIIIFITAFDEFALKAFEVRAIDYLMKPVRATRLAEAIGRAGKMRENTQQTLIADIIKEVGGSRQHFTIIERNRVLLVPVADVLYLKAEQKYVSLFTKQRSYLLEESLSSIEEDLATILVRVHRNTLVARNAIAGLERAIQVVEIDEDNEKLSESWQVLIKGVDERLPISRRQWPIIKNLVR